MLRFLTIVLLIGWGAALADCSRCDYPDLSLHSCHSDTTMK
jgi:hypothetical protein